ncbi:uncharacterized protein [Amphiura filiformis]|uniref:uncharacterized protein isoform X2 n=1 Tax=Amphiura filiformis TaxID=82378 RepID=UPI003B20FF94
MPRVKRQPARRLQQEGGTASVVDIQQEIERWNGVKTAHEFLNDMQVAQMLLDCYDLIGGNGLTWTNKEPPQSDEALQLKQKAEEGWETLQEICALMVESPEEEVEEEKEEDIVVIPLRKSRRKQVKVQHIKEEIEADAFVADALEEAVEESSADAEYVPETGSPGDEDPSSDWEILKKKTKHKAESPPKPPTARKRGDPEKGGAAKKEPKETKVKREPKEPKVVREPKRKTPKKEKVPKEPAEPKPKKESKRSGHQPVMPGHVIYECKVCATRVNSSKDEFLLHYASHGDETAATADGKIDIAKAAKLFFYCIKCDFVTHNRASHFSVKHSVVKEKTRICDICGASCANFNKWRYHRQSHMKSNKRFLCPICSKPFAKKSLLGAHIKRHSNKRSYICDLCGNVLKSQETLRRHKQTHLKMKPLTCTLCSKGFTSNYNLKCHMRSHTGEKPYRCDVCNSAFAHRISLRTHKKSVHGEDIMDTQYLIQEYDEELVQESKRTVIEVVEHIEVEKVKKEEVKKEADETLQATAMLETIQHPSMTVEVETHPSVPMKTEPPALVDMRSNIVVETCSSKLEEEVVETLTREFPSIGVISGGAGQPSGSYVIPVNLSDPGSHSFLVHVPAVDPSVAPNQTTYQTTYQTM